MFKVNFKCFRNVINIEIPTVESFLPSLKIKFIVPTVFNIMTSITFGVVMKLVKHILVFTYYISIDII